LLFPAPEINHMAGSAFDDSRIASGTLSRGGQKPGIAVPHAGESSSISRDDDRDGVPRVLSARTLMGNRVRNAAGEDLGKVEEIMLDVPRGRIAYAVLSFGGFLGMANKLFAVPWSALKLKTAEHEFILDISRETLENAPGFDKSHWPDMADPAFGARVHSHYGAPVYWEHMTTDAGDFIGTNERPGKSMEYEPTKGYRAASGNREKE
jgi:sporulation protein YlmC with PRC-barrel domain